MRTTMIIATVSALFPGSWVTLPESRAMTPPCGHTSFVKCPGCFATTGICQCQPSTPGVCSCTYSFKQTCSRGDFEWTYDPNENVIDGKEGVLVPCSFVYICSPASGIGSQCGVPKGKGPDCNVTDACVFIHINTYYAEAIIEGGPCNAD